MEKFFAELSPTVVGLRSLMQALKEILDAAATRIPACR
jgi:hypothetical protein